MKYLFGALALVLLGAGCMSGTVPKQADVGLIEDSTFAGVDGSLTEVAFDQVAEAFLDRASVLDESAYVTFASMQEELVDQHPTTDTFGQTIVLQLHGSGFLLISAGADGETDTADDYRKFYPLSE